MPRISYDLHIGNNRTRRGESMNKATRMLMMTGMAVVAGATFSAGPAAAASASPSPSAAKASTQEAAKAFPRSSSIEGWYRSRGACESAGNRGEWRNRWDDHDCIPINTGVHRRTWALKVYQNRHGFPGHGPGGHGGHGPGGHGPGGHGGHGPGGHGGHGPGGHGHH
jgi:hypothetical protein